MKDEPWIEAPEAAAHVGYAPTATRTQRAAIRLFLKFVTRHRIKRHYRGRRLVFRRSELDAAIDHCTETHDLSAQRDRFAHMAMLAKRHASG